MGVVVVTDSTSSLTAAAAAAAGVDVVPLHVVLGGTSYEDGAQVDEAAVAAAQQARTPVSTSRPTPRRLLDAYEAAAAAGADGVLSVHISAAMSGTLESAVLAARESPVPVRVVDSRSMGMGLGFLALAAARAAAGGAGLDELAETTRARALRTSAWFTVTTLEHLRRGGRIGPASALLGTALAIKPLLTLDDGIIAPLEKVRTTGRALVRLAELAQLAAAGVTAGAAASGAAPGAGVEVAVQHLAAPDRAAQLQSMLAERLPGVEVPVLPVGGAVAVHVGPGTVAVVVAPVS